MNKNESNMEKEFNVEKFVNRFVGTNVEKFDDIGVRIRKLRNLYETRDKLKKIIEAYKSDPNNSKSGLTINVLISIDMLKFERSEHVHVDSEHDKELSNVVIKYIEKEYDKVLNDITEFEKANSRIFKITEEIIDIIL